MAMNKVKVNSDAELKDRLVAINRVTKVTKGGRTFTFAAIVVVGDGKGVIGYGLGKAGDRYRSEGRWCYACCAGECRYHRCHRKV